MGDMLIIESGSTKADWCLLAEDGKMRRNFQTPGINAIVTHENEIWDIVKNVQDVIGYENKPTLVYFYGAGCIGGEANTRIKNLFSEYWPGADIDIESDILGAARALFQSNAGIACILGTGSCACHYDGRKIADRIPALGYVLGDEGSGAALGKRLLNGIFKRQFSTDIVSDFDNEYQQSLDDIIQRVYIDPSPNKFLGSFAPFILKHSQARDIHDMISEEFRNFFIKNVMPFKKEHDFKIGLVGSVAYHFKEIVHKTANELNLNISDIMKSPIEGLIKYHRNQRLYK